MVQRAGGCVARKLQCLRGDEWEESVVGPKLTRESRVIPLSAWSPLALSGVLSGDVNAGPLVGRVDSKAWPGS